MADEWRSLAGDEFAVLLPHSGAAEAGGKGRMQPFAVGLLQDGPGSVRLGHRLEAATENDELIVHRPQPTESR